MNFLSWHYLLENTHVSILQHYIISQMTSAIVDSPFSMRYDECNIVLKYFTLYDTIMNWL